MQANIIREFVPLVSKTQLLFIVSTLQRELSETRDTLRDTLQASDEVQSALSKVRLANKLNCTTQDLETKEMVCPKEKMGQVIGKSGATITKIQEACSVAIDVDNDTDKITVTGSASAIQTAMNEIEKIIRMEEVEVEIGNNLLRYLTGKYINILEQIRQEHPDAHVDVVRSSDKLSIRGAPEDVAVVKAKVIGLQLISKSCRLEGRKEYATLLGKKGVTIDNLCADHLVSIEVERIDDDSATAVVLGPPRNVESAMNDIEDLMDQNREVTEQLEISALMRNILLANGGSHIKAIQTRVTESLPDDNSCYITVKMDGAAKEHSEVVLKTKHSMMTQALEQTKSELKILGALSVEVTVDPHAVPSLIGKGGETIKKLTEGKDVFLEIEKNSGLICFGATTAEARDELQAKLDELLANNCVMRLPADPATLGSQYREFIRSSAKNQLNGKVRIDVDEEKSCYLLRGRQEDLETGKTLLEEFIANNKIGEVPITDEDRETLIMGGKTSKITQLSEELNVKLHIDREKHILFIRGKQEDVDTAVEKLNQYLNGGNGYSVVKLSITDQVVGVVIGKQGKTRQELEQKHEGVKITISKSNVVTIRGPEKSVADCKIEIGEKVAAARVTQNVPVSDEQKELLKKKDYARTIGPQTLVSINISGDDVVIKGSFYDVGDAVSLLNEMLTGQYKTAIELDASQFAKVRNTCRDPSHLQRMEEVSGAKIELDLASGAIAISGKRGAVKRAKDQVFKFLDFIIPGDINRVKITKPLFLSVGHAAELAKVSAAAGGVTVYLDRDLSLIVLRSSNKEQLEHATQLVKAQVKEAEKLAYVFEVSAADSWMLSAIIGKNGSKISQMRAKNPSCKIDVSKEARTVTVLADSEEAVARAKEAVRAAVEQAKNENVFISIPETYVPQFVGKGGAHVKQFSAEHGAEIQRIKKAQFNFKISGDASSVEATKNAIDKWLEQKEQADEVLTFKLEREKDVAAVLGEKGATIRSVQEEFKCKIDVDKSKLIVTVKGDTEEVRQAAADQLKSIVADNREKQAARQASKENRSNVNQVSSPVEVKMDEEDVDSDFISEFPSQPVGIVAAKNGGRNKRNKKVDASINEGTEEGKNLFAMLLADD
jgi:polyribonucleotide nucleotidyltransferase